MAHKAVEDLVRAMGEIAPLHLAEAWDNVGLLLGDTEWSLRGGVLLTIDLTESVAEEAVRLGMGAVVAYHPPIFSAVKRIACGPHRGGQSRALVRLMGERVAVYSPHTALDAVDGGVTEWLLRAVWPEALMAMAIRPSAIKRPGEDYKVVVFIPTDPPGLLDRVREQLARVGAGVIGRYTSCSFAAQGIGTFVGGEGSSPAVGVAGRFEQVAESRLEMVCSEAALPMVRSALRGCHPYEEPAVHVFKLEPQREWTTGAGRVIRAPEGLRPSEVAARLKAGLALRGVVPTVQYASPGGADEVAWMVAAVPGSGGSLLDEAVAMGCRLFITGEMKHHDVLRALDLGCSVVLAGHTETERGFLPVLAKRLEAMGVRAVVSEKDGAVLRGAG